MHATIYTTIFNHFMSVAEMEKVVKNYIGPNHGQCRFSSGIELLKIILINMLKCGLMASTKAYYINEQPPSSQ